MSGLVKLSMARAQTLFRISRETYILVSSSTHAHAYNDDGIQDLG